MNQSASFSWRRFCNVARFYSLSVKMQLLIYAVIIVGLYFAAMLSKNYLGTDFIIWMVGSTVINFMVYLAPLVFYKYDNVELTAQLPALGREKASFIIGYIILVVPCFILALWGVCLLVGSLFPAENVSFVSILGMNDLSNSFAQSLLGPQVIKLIVPSTLFGWMMTLSITTFVSISARRNKVVKCILAAVLTQIIVGIIGVILGVVYAVFEVHTFIAETADGIGGKDFESGFLGTLDGFVGNYMLICLSMTLVVAVTMFVLAWRKICYRQV